MKSTINLSVPKPCTEKWGSFAPTSTGGFCSSCQKNVIDFTKVSDDEIYLFFKSKPAHACGRFHVDQLKTYSDSIRAPHSVPGMTLLKAGFLSLLFMLINKPASAQSEPAKQKRELVSKDETVGAIASKKEFSVHGTVRSVEDGLPLPGVNVVIKGAINAGITDSEGRFKIDAALGDILIFSFIGLKTEEYVVRGNQEGVEIKLAIDSENLNEIIVAGEVNVEGPYTSHQSWLRNAWTKFKGLF